MDRHQKKIRFDVLPESPIVLTDDDSGVDKFEVAPLLRPKSRRARDVQRRNKRKLSSFARNYNYIPQPNDFSKPNYVRSQPRFTAYQSDNDYGYQYSPYRR